MIIHLNFIMCIFVYRDIFNLVPPNVCCLQLGMASLTAFVWSVNNVNGAD